MEKSRAKSLYLRRRGKALKTSANLVLQLGVRALEAARMLDLQANYSEKHLEVLVRVYPDHNTQEVL